MPRTPAKFTQADVARALRAIAQTSAAMELVLEPDGRIRIIPRAPLTQQTPPADTAFDYAGDIRL